MPDDEPPLAVCPLFGCAFPTQPPVQRSSVGFLLLGLESGVEPVGEESEAADVAALSSSSSSSSSSVRVISLAPCLCPCRRVESGELVPFWPELAEVGGNSEWAVVPADLEEGQLYYTFEGIRAVRRDGPVSGRAELLLSVIGQPMHCQVRAAAAFFAPASAAASPVWVALPPHRYLRCRPWRSPCYRAALARAEG